MNYVLRPYQVEAVEAGLKHLSSKVGKGGILVEPTGSGKSLVIAGIVKQLKEPTLIFQPSKEILEQNFMKYQDYGGQASIYSASMNSKKISNVTFATIGSVVRKPDLFKQFKNIIVDECHFVNAKNGMYKEFLGIVGERFLGLTATPYRLITDGFGGSILKFLTRTRPRVFDQVLHITQNDFLFDNGWLATLEYKLNPNFDSGQLHLNSTGADYTDTSVRSYYEKINFIGILARYVKRALKVGRKNILVFTRFVQESQALVDALGPEAAIVSAETKKRDRADIIKRFRSGQIKVVSNVGVLTTGFDYPELETIVMARPTMSLALYYQMIGRGIRPHPNKQSTWVIDLCNNFSKFGRVEDLRLGGDAKGLWVVKSKGRQLTNIYFGEAPFRHRRAR